MAQRALANPKRGSRRRNTTWKRLPWVRTAAWAAWFKMRRKWALPLADRLERETPALSSWPGANAGPGGQLRRRVESRGGNAHLGDDLVGGIDADAGHLGQAFDGLLMVVQAFGQQAMNLGDLAIQKIEPFQMASQHVPVYKSGLAGERVAELFRAALQAGVAQGGQFDRIALAGRQGAQDALPAGSP